ncbi:hypothetical protein [Bacillus sp. EAC]|uniref:hypothetical protein n=1 Tax=Bacillus sp. EAC TaxID=1978338 RepID=UPI000B4454A1|nr:hypothetical protein [Bacillus sp. EAC]
MEVVQRKKRFKTGGILVIVVIGLIIGTNINTIRSSLNKFFIQQTKEETTLTKTLTTDDIGQIKGKQEALFYKYIQETKRKWLCEEIHDGAFTIYKTVVFMREHPEYDSVKIKFKVTKYKVNGKTVEFMSESKITKLHSKNGWKDK